MLNNLLKRAYNLLGWHTDRKLVVIESDDWGSIKMPSRKTYDYLIKKGYEVDKDPYSKYDCLESNSDLEALFEVLNSVKDKNGNPAVLTANAVVANPDFERIKQDNFERYHYEAVTETFHKYPAHDQAFALWQEGYQKGFFVPQYHGREHLNVDRWMLDLRNGTPHLHEAFEQQMFTFSFLPSYLRFGYMEGLDFFSEAEKESKHQILKEGHELFVNLIGYPSQTFIANCYIWHNDFEQTLAELGIKAFQSNVFQLSPHNKGKKHFLKRRLHFTGQRNHFNQIYTVRNVHFEPSFKTFTEPVNISLQQIEMAFRSRKPAMISSHRLNYIGGIFEENRDNNLRQLQDLLNGIIKKWPEVEFLSSVQLVNIIDKQV